MKPFPGSGHHLSPPRPGTPQLPRILRLAHQLADGAFELRPGQQKHPAAFFAAQAEIDPRAHYGPEVTTAGMAFLEAHHVAHPVPDRCRYTHSARKAW